MRRLIALLACLLLATPSMAQNITINPPFTAGQLPGTPTNDQASAGNVGETPIFDNLPQPSTNATVTISLANPAVITWAGNPFDASLAFPVVFTTTGTLPLNITSGTQYWTIPTSWTSSTFQIATSVTNALAGTAVSTLGGSQSGTQTGTAKMGSFATGTVTSISGAKILKGGSYLVYGVLGWQPAVTTTMSVLSCSVSTTDNSQGALMGYGSSWLPMYGTTADATDSELVQTCGPFQLTIASGGTANVFLVAMARFATSTMNVRGGLQVIRIR